MYNLISCDVCVTLLTSCVHHPHVPFSFSDEPPMIPPRVTTHPQDLNDAVLGQLVRFTAEATGTPPLNYQWEWKSAMEDGEWQLCDVERFPGADSSTLTIPSVQKSNEGSYRCVISNYAATQISNPAKLGVGKNPD